jgi:hypothetical protein
MAQQLRERIDKWDYTKLESFCTTKEMVSKLKRLPQNGGKSSFTSDNRNIQKAQKNKLSKTSMPQ